VEAADRALDLDPRSSYALLARAEALRGTGEVREALAAYQELLARNDTRVEARAAKGALECLAELGEWQQILNVLPAWLPPSRGLRWKIKALAGLGRSEEATEACREWLRVTPDHREALWQLTELEIQRDGLEAVRSRLGRLARIPSRPPIYGEIYASLCRRAGDEEKAQAQYAKLAAAAPDPRISRKQAFSLAKSGREHEAIPMMEELLRLNPTDRYLHSAYGAACERIGCLEQGLSFYQSLIAANPDHKTLYGPMNRIRTKIKRQAS
jgi:tetratricopeptide (TPR) repeat protein